MKYLFILNDSPHGTQRSYNGLRLALSLTKRFSNEVRVFLIGDAVVSALAAQNPLHVYYNLQEMLGHLAAGGSEIGLCRTCLEARGIPPNALIPGTRVSTLDELTDWTEEAEKVLVF